MLKAISQLFFACTFVFSTAAQTGTLMGRIDDERSNNYLKSADVIVSDVKFSTTSDSKGKYLIYDIPAGSYTVTVSYVGYRSETKEVNVSAGEPVELDFHLTPTAVKMDEVQISSIRYRTLENETPLPMETMSSKEIEKISPITAPDAVSREPGINLVSDGAWGKDVNIRGLSRSSVVTLVDGYRVETATELAAGMSMIDVNDVERIEIIKGAASSLYGTGALGGVVNIITRTPAYTTGFDVSGSLSSAFNSVNNSGMGYLNINAAGENYYFKFSGMMRSADDMETPEGTLENSQFRDNNLSASFGFKPVESHELKLNYQRFYAEDVGIPGGAALPPTATATYPEEWRELYSVEYDIKTLFPSLLKTSVKYFHQEIRRDVEIHPGPPVILTPNAYHIMNGAQLQTDWMPGGGHYLVAGVDFWQRALDSRRQRHLLANGNIIGERPLPVSEYRSFGFYVQDEADLIKNRLKLTLGGRVDYINVINDDAYNPEWLMTADGSVNYSPPNQVLTFEENDVTNFSWSTNLGFIYAMSAGLDATFSVARSFRSPTMEERYQYIDLGSLVRAGDPDLEPEKGIFFDLGLRYRDSGIFLKGNVFLNLLNDLVVETPGTFNGRDAFIKTNIGEARLYGFDARAEYDFSDLFVIYGNAAYVKGDDTRNDEDLPQIPPFNGSAGIKSNIYGYVNVDFSGTYFHEQNDLAEGETYTPGYVYYDLYLTSAAFALAGSEFRVIAGVENIFDRPFRNHLATNRGLINIEPGRNLFIKLSVNW